MMTMSLGPLTCTVKPVWPFALSEVWPDVSPSVTVKGWEIRRGPGDLRPAGVEGVDRQRAAERGAGVERRRDDLDAGHDAVQLRLQVGARAGRDRVRLGEGRELVGRAGAVEQREGVAHLAGRGRDRDGARLPRGEVVQLPPGALESATVVVRGTPAGRVVLPSTELIVTWIAAELGDT